MKRTTNKKFILILLLSLSLFLISGCALFDVKIGIDSNNTAYLSYHLEMDVSEYNAHQQHNFKHALFEMAVHYHENLGFSVNLETDSNPLTLTAEKRINNNSFENAFESLKTMLSDEKMTIFMQVDMAEVNYPRQSAYIISAQADIPRILKSNDLDELPPGLRRSLDEAIKTSTGTITINIPADEIVSASHDAEILTGYAGMEVPLSFTGQTSFELSAIRNMPDGVSDGSIGGVIQQQLRALFPNNDDSFIEEQLRFQEVAVKISLAAAVLIIITIAITIIVAIVKRRRKINYL